MKLQSNLWLTLIIALLYTSVYGSTNANVSSGPDPIKAEIENKSVLIIIVIRNTKKKGVGEVVGFYPDVPTVQAAGMEGIKAEVHLEGNSFYIGWPDIKPSYKALKVNRGTVIDRAIALKMGLKGAFKLRGGMIKMADPPHTCQAML